MAAARLVYLLLLLHSAVAVAGCSCCLWPLQGQLHAAALLLQVLQVLPLSLHLLHQVFKLSTQGF
jgi:hypothetical protein